LRISVYVWSVPSTKTFRSCSFWPIALKPGISKLWTNPSKERMNWMNWW
jgi:hypothetical protein